MGNEGRQISSFSSISVLVLFSLLTKRWFVLRLLVFYTSLQYTFLQLVSFCVFLTLFQDCFFTRNEFSYYYIFINCILYIRITVVVCTFRDFDQLANLLPLRTFFSCAFWKHFRPISNWKLSLGFKERHFANSLASTKALNFPKVRPNRKIHY